jgi:hypothetical protein
MRTITVVLQIEDAEEARQLWTSHLDGKLVAGCKVQSISNGNVQKALDKVIQYAYEQDDKGHLPGNLGETLQSVVDEVQLGNLYNTGEKK